MVMSSIILKESTATNERGLKKSACPRPSVDSYTCLSLTRGDKTRGVVQMAEVVGERKTGKGEHPPSQEREMGIAVTGNCG